MAYGFDIHVSGTDREVTLMRTYNGEGVGQKVQEINGRITRAMSRDEIKWLLNFAKEKRQEITFILDSNQTLIFKPDQITQSEWERFSEAVASSS